MPPSAPSNPTPPRRPLALAALEPLLGGPHGPARARRATLQPFAGGLLLRLAGQPRGLALHADGRLSATARQAPGALGQPLAAPMSLAPLYVQKFQVGTVLWSAATGPLLLRAGRWQIPLEVAA